MSESNDTTKRAGGKTLTLKKVETSTVKQSFSHGRTKAVVVEKKRSAHPTTPGAPAPKTAPAQTTQVSETRPAAPSVPTRDANARAGVVLRQLTEEEKARRGAALADARVAEEDARKNAVEEAKLRAVEDAKLAKEREAAARRRFHGHLREAPDRLNRRFQTLAEPDGIALPWL